MRTIPKNLKFPTDGLKQDLSFTESTLPSERGSFGTPFAVNVRGTASFHGRLRGGSRPGLKLATDQNPKQIHPFVNPSQGSTASVSGTAPTGFTAYAEYRARQFYSVGSVWYCNRTGVKTDWNYGADADDITRAAYGNVNMAGKSGDAITAFMPLGDEFMLIATAREVYAMHGEPTVGRVMRVSNRCGCVSKDAWCANAKWVVALSSNGLFMFQPGEPPVEIGGNIPDELKGCSWAKLAYDTHDNGIHVLSDKGDFYFEMDAKAWWPVKFPQTIAPTSMSYSMQGGAERVLFSCDNGKKYYFDDDKATDDGADIVSKVAIGPFRLGEVHESDGIIAELTPTFACENGEDVTVKVFTADSAEQAVANAKTGTTTREYAFGSGRSKVVRPRMRGAWCVVMVEADSRWAYESITAVTKQLGRLR